MSEYQEWAVEFECKKSKLDKLLGICRDCGLDIPKDNCYDTKDGMVEVNFCNADNCSYEFYGDLVKMKQKLIKAGAENVSVKHAWPSELVEVEDYKGSKRGKFKKIVRRKQS